MIIEAIEISGWMPFAEHVRLDLPAGPIAIVGMHSGDSRRSNRAGKTALNEAITWCLFGKHRKRVDDDVINHGCDEARVLLEIEGMTIERTKQRGHSTKLKLSILTQHWNGDTAQDEIEQRIGLSFADYTATSCFRQGDVDSVVMQSPADRLLLVSKWLQQDAWYAAKKIQSAKVSEADRQLAQKAGELNAFKGQLLSLGDKLRLKNELALKQLLAEDKGKRAEFLVTEMMSRVSVKLQLSNLIELDELRERAISLRKQLTERRQAQEAFDAAEQAHQKVLRDAKDLEASLAKDAKIRAVGFDGQCPVMCQVCPVSEQVTKTVRDATDLRVQLELRDRAYREALQTTRDAMVAARAELAVYERASAEYQQVIERGKALSASITSELSADEIEKLPGPEPIQRELEQIRVEMNPVQQRMGEITRTLEMADAAEAKHKVLVKEIDAYEDESKASHLALRAIASIPAKIAQQQLVELEQEVNLLLQGTGVSIRFSWQRELGDKSPICTECGYTFTSKRPDECPSCKTARGKKLAQELELLADDGSGVEEDVRFNSGGTRAIVGAAMRLAASAMLRRMRSSQAAWAIVDEPFGSLDTENREQLARTFAGMLGSVGLAQALVVSHDPLLLSALPHRIVINKDGVNSTLTLE